MKKIVLIVCICCGACASGGYLSLDDGGTYTLDSFHDNYLAIVQNSINGDPTTLEVVEGGYLYGRIDAWEDSKINVSGGTIDLAIIAYDNTTVNFSGGQARHLSGEGNSIFNVTGGKLDYGISARGNSQYNISGGVMTTLASRDNSNVVITGGTGSNYVAFGNTQVSIMGGTLNSISANGNCEIILSGGLIEDVVYVSSGTVSIVGGSIGSALLTFDGGTIIIDGKDFCIDGIGVDYGQIFGQGFMSYEDEPVRRLTGILASGETIDNDFYIMGDSSFMLIPEPASCLILSIGSVMILRRNSVRNKLTD